jgi:aspartate/methionine/tyrosine aminotransferase
VEFVEPHGAFYFFFRVDGLRPEGAALAGESEGGGGGHAFCTRLLEDEGIALVPGAAFGDDRWVRLSYALAERDLARALDRLMLFMTRLASRAA